jgi:hypothetical protein
MRAIVASVLWLAASLIAFAAAPIDVTGFVYSEAVEVAAPGPARSRSRVEVLLREGGIAQGIWQSVQRSPDFSIPRLSIPADGRWSYQRLDENRGILTIDGVARTLTFTTAQGGSVDPPGALTLRQFSIAVYEPSKAINCSNRSFVRIGGSAFTGFVVTGTKSNRVLVRAVGPGLQKFGISEALRAPFLKIVRADSGLVVLSNGGWAGDPDIAQVSSRAGAFALDPDSPDSAAFLSLEAGAYVAEVSSSLRGDSGQVLIEVYVLP